MLRNPCQHVSRRLRHRLANSEADLERDEHRYRLAHPGAWLKSPFPRRGNRLLIESKHHVERFHDADVGASAVWPYDAVENDDALKAGAHGFRGVCGWRAPHGDWRRHSVADRKNTIAAGARPCLIAGPRTSLVPSAADASSARRFGGRRDGRCGRRSGRLGFRCNCFGLDDHRRRWRCRYSRLRCRRRQCWFRWRTTTSASRRARIRNPDKVREFKSRDTWRRLFSTVRDKDQERDDHRRVYGDRHRERRGEMAGLAVHSVIRRSPTLFGLRSP